MKVHEGSQKVIHGSTENRAVKLQSENMKIKRCLSPDSHFLNVQFMRRRGALFYTYTTL